MSARELTGSTLLLLLVFSLALMFATSDTAVADGHMARATMAYPTGDVATSAVLIEKSAPARVRLGEMFDYEIKVSNLTDLLLDQVVVLEILSADFAISNSTPEAKVMAGDADAATEGEVQWDLGRLQPRESKLIQVSGTAKKTSPITNCTTVTYRPFVCVTIDVVQPQLELVKTAPAEVLLCDPIPVKFVVSNPGVGDLQDVAINDTLPAGLATLGGETQINFDVGVLRAGQSREYNVIVKAAQTGEYVNTAVATAEAGLTAESSTTTVVRQPVLTIAKEGTKKTFLGRQIQYTISTSNTGDADAANAVLEDVVPSGTSFVSASDGGEFDGYRISWNLGTMEPNASREVSLTLVAEQFGTFVNRATLNAVCAKPVSASAKTEVVGIPAVLLEVIDVEDPIQIGSEETYIITATNQGSAVDTNIVIKCILEDNMTHVSSSGATSASVDGQVITFEALPRLAPKAKAEWRVVVKALGAGDTRFSVEMNTDELDRPVRETEATNLYE